MNDPMGETRTTNWLLLLIAMMMFIRLYPDTVRAYGVYVLAGLGLWGIYSFVKTWRRDEAERKAERAETTRNIGFMNALDAIRKKYDPKGEWNEATSLPPGYCQEVDELRARFGIRD